MRMQLKRTASSSSSPSCNSLLLKFTSLFNTVAVVCGYRVTVLTFMSYFAFVFMLWQPIFPSYKQCFSNCSIQVKARCLVYRYIRVTDRKKLELHNSLLDIVEQLYCLCEQITSGESYLATGRIEPFPSRLKRWGPPSVTTWEFPGVSTPN